MKKGLAVLIGLLGLLTVPQVSDFVLGLAAANPTVAKYAIPVVGFVLYLVKSPFWADLTKDAAPPVA